MHTKDAHRVCGGPTLRVAERFRKNQSANFMRDVLMSEHRFMSEILDNRVTSKLPRGLNERTFMSEPIENHAISKLSTAHLNNHQCKHRRRFRRNREPSRIPIRSLKRLRNKSRKVRKLSMQVFFSVLLCRM